METYLEVQIELRAFLAFLTLVLDGSKCSASRPRGDWVDASLDVEENLCLYQDSNTRRQAYVGLLYPVD